MSRRAFGAIVLGAESRVLSNKVEVAGNSNTGRMVDWALYSARSSPMSSSAVSSSTRRRR